MKRSKPHKQRTRGGRREVSLTPETEAMLITLADVKKQTVSYLIRDLIRKEFNRVLEEE